MGSPTPRLQTATSDRLANLIHELPIDRHARRRINLKFHDSLGTVLSVLVQ